MAQPRRVFPAETLLGKLPPPALAALERIWSVSHFDKGRMIMTAEERNADVCFLLEGTARVALFTASGREISVLTFNTGDVFGEFSAIDNAPRSANIEALSPCIAARIPAERFRKLLKEAPELSFALLELLVGKLRDLTGKVSDFSAHNADYRIRAELLRLARSAAKGKPSCRIDRPPTQTEIAARVFSNREAVAREMGKMKRAGLLGRDGRALTIPSVDALERFLEEAEQD